MLQSIVQSSQLFESTFLRSYVYRLKFKNLSCCLNCRNFSNQRTKPEEKQNDANSIRSIPRTWKRFHFPSSNQLFKADNVDPSEWSMVYRLKWSLKMIYMITYGHLLALFASITVLYRIFVEGKKYYSKMVVDQPLFQAALVFCCSMVIVISVLIFRLFTKTVFRGYYSPKYQRFIFIRPSFLTPWQVRKLIVAPGVIEPIQPGTIRMLKANFKIKNIDLFIFERNFFFPAYYNVLCGFTPPQSLANIRFDPDSRFSASMKKGV